MTGGLTLLLCAVALAGVLSLRAGWGRQQGRHFVAAGWALIVVSVAALTVRDGAWGFSVGTIAVMLAASAVLARAALASAAPAREKAVRAAAPSILLRPGGIGGTLRRFAVFILVVPVAVAVAALVALAFQAAARHAGCWESDSTALGLFVFPVAWTILVTLLMVKPGPKAMLAPLVGTAVAAGALYWIFA